MMVRRWLDAVAAELGVEPADAGPLLDTARAVAHDVERRAAPLTTYLIGVAVGRRPHATTREICDLVNGMLTAWQPRGSDADGSTS